MGSGMPSLDGAAGTSTGGKRSRSTRRGPCATPASIAPPKEGHRAARGPPSRATRKTARTPAALGPRASTGSPGQPCPGSAGVIAASCSRSMPRLRARKAAVARLCAARIAARGRRPCGAPVASTLGVRAARAVPIGTTRGHAVGCGTPTRRGPSGRSCPATGACAPCRLDTTNAAGPARRCSPTLGTRLASGISAVSARAGGRRGVGGPVPAKVFRMRVGPGRVARPPGAVGATWRIASLAAMGSRFTGTGIIGPLRRTSVLAARPSARLA